MELDEIKKKYMSPKNACEILGVHPRTLYQWEDKKWIDVVRSKGGKRFYDVNTYLKKMKPLEEDKDDKEDIDIDKMDRVKLTYVRVSTRGQKSDLEHQINYMKNKYPNHFMIKDIGSGMNLNKRGIRKIIKLAIAGKI